MATIRPKNKYSNYLILVGIIVLVIISFIWDRNFIKNGGSAMSFISHIFTADGKIIEIVKTIELGISPQTVNIYDGMNHYAGVNGSVNWRVSYPNEINDKPDLCVVEGTARKYSSGDVLNVKLLLNKINGEFEVVNSTKNVRELRKLELMGSQNFNVYVVKTK